jgi:hypothetical protein
VSDVDWLLMCHGELLGTLTLKDSDMFWFFCAFQAENAFEQLRPLFDRQSVLAENDDYSSVEWEELEDQITALDLFLEGVGGRSNYEEFILNIDGREASIRPML